uniref:Uncharacterized protein n=1 Tax=Steinernema glaseri TaxID=37863 RepID=A0A1I7Z760_9BILA
MVSRLSETYYCLPLVTRQTAPQSLNTCYPKQRTWQASPARLTITGRTSVTRASPPPHTISSFKVDIQTQYLLLHDASFPNASKREFGRQTCARDQIAAAISERLQRTVMDGGLQEKPTKGQVVNP